MKDGYRVFAFACGVPAAIMALIAVVRLAQTFTAVVDEALCNQQQQESELSTISSEASEMEIALTRATESRNGLGPLANTITSWIAFNFDLPPPTELPAIEFVPITRIAELRTKSSGYEIDDLVRPGRFLIMSWYDKQSKTIYLPKGWRGERPSEISLLVREMVKHFQNIGEMRYECDHAQDKLGYDAQEKWLAMFGHSITEAFGIAPDALRLSTQCILYP